MAELFINGKLFIEVDREFYDEKDFQGVVKNNILQRTNLDLNGENELLCLFMDYRVSSPQGNTQPDLIIFDKQCTHYWIVEVELSTHSWESHVEEQLEKLTEANYSGKSHKILKNIKNTNEAFNFDEERFIKLIQYSEPNFMLVLDKTPSWKQKAIESSLNFKYIEFKTFKSSANESLYYTDGLTLSLENESLLRPVSYYYQLDRNSNFVQYDNKDKLIAELNGVELTLNITKTRGDLYFFPVPRDVLKEGRYYYIKPLSDSRAVLREKK